MGRRYPVRACRQTPDPRPPNDTEGTGPLSPLCRSAVVGILVCTALIVTLSGCADDDTAPSEAVAAYDAVIADPLWHHRPPGFEKGEPDQGDRSASCTLEPHSTTFREVFVPYWLLSGPRGDDLDAPLNDFIAFGTDHGWTVTAGPADVDPTDEDERRAVSLTKDLEGHRTDLDIEAYDAGDEILLSLNASIPDVEVCPPNKEN